MLFDPQGQNCLRTIFVRNPQLQRSLVVVMVASIWLLCIEEILYFLHMVKSVSRCSGWPSKTASDTGVTGLTEGCNMAKI